MLSQQSLVVNIGGLPKSKPIDIIKKSGSFCINIDEDEKIEEQINETIYDYVNKSNNCLDEKYKRSLGKEESPEKTITNNYRLDSICFDPTKFSPPDEWSIRLKKRIRSYRNTGSSNDLYIDYLFDNK
jgi:hypothetical protein